MDESFLKEDIKLTLKGLGLGKAQVSMECMRCFIKNTRTLWEMK